MYDEVVSEPLPTDFLSILEQADDRGPDGRDPQKKTVDETEPMESAPVGRAVKSQP
jgi:hypothetical protein